MNRDSSGRFLETGSVAKRLGVSPAAVRQMKERGELIPAHVTVGGIAIYAAEYIEERAKARQLRVIGREQLDRALGFGQAVSRLPPEVQGELPLVGRE